MFVYIIDVQNTQMHCVGKIYIFLIFQHVVFIVTTEL